MREYIYIYIYIFYSNKKILNIREFAWMMFLCIFKSPFFFYILIICRVLTDVKFNFRVSKGVKDSKFSNSLPKLFLWELENELKEPSTL